MSSTPSSGIGSLSPSPSSPNMALPIADSDEKHHTIVSHIDVAVAAMRGSEEVRSVLDPASIKDKSYKPTEEELRKRMEETVQNIREKADRIQAAAQPYAETTRSFAEVRPVLFTFLTIFALTSAVPLFCFAAFLLGATLFTLSIAAIGICVTLFFTIILASCVLIPVLFFTFFLSASALSFLLVLFLAHRLYLHITAACSVRSADAAESNPANDQADNDTMREYSYERISSGVRSWFIETKDRIVPDRYASSIGRDQESADTAVSSLMSEKIEQEVDNVGQALEVTILNVDPLASKGSKKVRWSISNGSDGKVNIGKSVDEPIVKDEREDGAENLAELIHGAE